MGQLLALVEDEEVAPAAEGVAEAAAEAAQLPNLAPISGNIQAGEPRVRVAAVAAAVAGDAVHEERVALKFHGSSCSWR